MAMHYKVNKDTFHQQICGSKPIVANRLSNQDRNPPLNKPGDCDFD